MIFYFYDVILLHSFQNTNHSLDAKAYQIGNLLPRELNFKCKSRLILLKTFEEIQKPGNPYLRIIGGHILHHYQLVVKPVREAGIHFKGCFGIFIQHIDKIAFWQANNGAWCECDGIHRISFLNKKHSDRRNSDVPTVYCG
jgi:hypothetical protein